MNKDHINLFDSWGRGLVLMGQAASWLLIDGAHGDLKKRKWKLVAADGGVKTK